MLSTPDESVRRVRSLCGSLECILICAETVEQNSSHIGSALFLLTELRDAIDQFENAVLGFDAEADATNDQSVG
jgi:hypothetical protein